MARTKPAGALERSPSEVHASDENLYKNGLLDATMSTSYNGKLHTPAENKSSPQSQSQPGLLQLSICVAGIYTAFLTWGVLQERITTTPYGPLGERFKYPIFLNTLQSLCAAGTGYLYLRLSSPSSSNIPPIFPSRAILYPLLLIATTSALASPFGYASLTYIDYITFILAKSCKLLPVMFLHLTIFRRRYPLYKYLVVACVTAGVAVFTLHSPSKKMKRSPGSEGAGGNASWGLLLLGINLLFDGLTNSTQDHIFQTFRGFTGPQMMCAQNIMSSLLTVGYMLLSPYVAPTFVGRYVGMGQGGELWNAVAFLQTYPQVAYDVFGFAICGGVGQVFIFYTLSKFSSLVLVTVTVTRKMFTMLLSVMWFGHTISLMQWAGVALVFGGIGAEGWVGQREKAVKAKAKAQSEGDGKKEL